MTWLRRWGMSWLAEHPHRFPILTAASVGPPLRGRVHRVSIVAGGEVSVVLRFGGEEIAARALEQGALAELRVMPTPPAPKEST
jgi:hypothetical protein